MKRVKTSKTKSGKKFRDRSAESCLRTSSVSEWRLQELVLILHLAGDGFFFFFAVFLLVTYSNVMTLIF